jgi:hypothetical protein
MRAVQPHPLLAQASGALMAHLYQALNTPTEKYKDPEPQVERKLQEPTRTPTNVSGYSAKSVETCNIYD